MKKTILFTGFLVLCAVGLAYAWSNIIVNGGGVPAAGGVWVPINDANCMGAWYMNGGLSANGDNETDRSGEGGTLTESGGDLPNSATVPSGYSGSSRDFEYGDTEWLEEADGGSTDIGGADQDITICLWFRVETPTSTMYLVSKYLPQDFDRQYLLWVNDSSSDHVTFSISGTGASAGVVSAESTSPVQAGTYCHICGVYDDDEGSGDNLQIWINGSMETAESTTAGIHNGSAEFHIGNNGNESGPADGLIDEVIIFNRALNSTEINSIKDNGIDGTKGATD